MEQISFINQTFYTFFKLFKVACRNSGEVEMEGSVNFLSLVLVLNRPKKVSKIFFFDVLGVKQLYHILKKAPFWSFLAPRWVQNPSKTSKNRDFFLFFVCILIIYKISYFLFLAPGPPIYFRIFQPNK